MELNTDFLLDDLSLFSSDKLLEPALPLDAKPADVQPDVLQLLVQSTLGHVSNPPATVAASSWVENSTDLQSLLVPGPATAPDSEMVSLSEAIDLLSGEAPVKDVDNVDQLLQMLDGGHADVPEVVQLCEPELPHVLQHVTPDDVESVLSSSPPLSPSASSSCEDEWKPTKKKRAAPYSRTNRTMSERKQRKKQQNKEAALRYREKKRQESDLVQNECQLLEDRNKELKDKVDEMCREMQYLKNLLKEVYRAREASK